MIKFILIVVFLTSTTFSFTEVRITQGAIPTITEVEREIFKWAHKYHGIDESWFDLERGEYGFLRNGEWCSLFRSIKWKGEKICSF